MDTYDITDPKFYETCKPLLEKDPSNINILWKKVSDYLHDERNINVLKEELKKYYDEFENLREPLNDIANYINLYMTYIYFKND